MAEPKPFASLSSGLLARKGQAKPAMRPQGFAGFGPITNGHDDLGWNDMGFDPPRPAIDVHPAEENLEAHGDQEELPPVLRERVELAEELATAEPEPRVNPLLASKPSRSAPTKRQALDRDVPERSLVARGSKAAFTLRLDPERHLQLRLACAMHNRSAQQLVTAALDAYLETIPELDEIAGRLPARKAN